MTKQGVRMLPPAISLNQAIKLLRNLADISMLMGNMKNEFSHTIVGDALVNLFTLSESVQSTRIEGTQVTFTDVIDPSPEQKKSWEQREVMNYQKALRDGLEQIKKGEPFSTRMLLRLHKILMTDARGTSSAGGEFRKIQNFIGRDNNIDHASYIPIGANEIPAYMENLEHYVNGYVHCSFIKHATEDVFVIDEKAPEILKLAVMHAQFESIHPFLDGNGRLGRILIALMAVRYELTDSPIFLVSEELERERLRYYDLLNAVRGNDPDWYSWLSFFVDCCGNMARRLVAKMRNSVKLAENGMKRLTTVSEQKVWIASFHDPVLTASAVSAQVKLSPATVRKALKSLAEKGMLYTSKEQQRKRKYVNYDLLRILNN